MLKREVWCSELERFADWSIGSADATRHGKQAEKEGGVISIRSCRFHLSVVDQQYVLYFLRTTKFHHLLGDWNELCVVTRLRYLAFVFL